MERLRERFDQMLKEMEDRFDQLCVSWNEKLDALHRENTSRLKSIDHTARNNAETLNAIALTQAQQGVKLDALYGNGNGTKGAVEKLQDDTRRVGEKVMYGCGGVAAAVILVGWYLAWHR